jgi:LCP family protein required for cell wall assembly
MAYFEKDSALRRSLYSFFMILVIPGAIYSSYLYFTTVRALAARTPISLVEGGVVQPPPIPIIPRRASGGEEDPVVEEQKERVNVLLLGIDQRVGEPGPWRTDTMMLVSVDPVTRSASLLSIPRDLWVTIPGYGEGRINTAHFIGDSRDYPGGGPALAKKTVWYALGIPVHYYVRINFTGFEQLIDAIGGLTIDVPKRIYDTRYPDENYGTMIIDIPAGLQPMDGVTALQYARSRHGNSDFDRMERQQAILLAARDKALSLDIPISRIPRMLELVGDSLSTDMPLDRIIAVAEIAKQIDRSNIRHGTIDGTMTTTVVTPQGAMVEVPNWDQVRRLVDELFPPPGVAAEPTVEIDIARLNTEGARIELRNGTLSTDLAQTVANELSDEGYMIVRYGNADRFDHERTLMTVHTQLDYTVRMLTERFDLDEADIRFDPRTDVDADIVIILGRDQVQ